MIVPLGFVANLWPEELVLPPVARISLPMMFVIIAILFGWQGLRVTLWLAWGIAEAGLVYFLLHRIQTAAVPVPRVWMTRAMMLAFTSMLLTHF